MASDASIATTSEERSCQSGKDRGPSGSPTGEGRTGPCWPCSTTVTSRSSSESMAFPGRLVSTPRRAARRSTASTCSTTVSGARPEHSGTRRSASGTCAPGLRDCAGSISPTWSSTTSWKKSGSPSSTSAAGTTGTASVAQFSSPSSASIWTRPTTRNLDFSKVPRIAGVPRFLDRTLLTRVRDLVKAHARRDPATAFEHEVWLCFFAGLARQRWIDRKIPIPAYHGDGTLTPV